MWPHIHVHYYSTTRCFSFSRMEQTFFPCQDEQLCGILSSWCIILSTCYSPALVDPPRILCAGDWPLRRASSGLPCALASSWNQLIKDTDRDQRASDERSQSIYRPLPLAGAPGAAEPSVKHCSWWLASLSPGHPSASSSFTLKAGVASYCWESLDASPPLVGSFNSNHIAIKKPMINFLWLIPLCVPSVSCPHPHWPRCHCVDVP